jgi:hypothetical protein
MLNWADFSGLLMIFLGPLCGIAAAHSHKAPISSLIVFGFVGLCLGICGAAISIKLTDSIFRTKKLSAGVGGTLYMLVPCAGIFLVVIAPYILAGILYGWK